MTPQEYLAAYAAGWTNGDGEVIVGACSPRFVFHDPNVKGGVDLKKFRGHFDSLRREVLKRLGHGVPALPFMELSEVQLSEAEGGLTAWCRWRIPGTPMEGSGLIKVGLEGVEYEWICYHAPVA